MITAELGVGVMQLVNVITLKLKSVQPGEMTFSQRRMYSSARSVDIVYI